MNMPQIKEIAKSMNVKISKMRKVDAIRTIQEAEGNPDCYGTERYAVCQEGGCLWKSDCEIKEK